MKIENNGINPLLANNAASLYRVDKKTADEKKVPLDTERGDRAELSENARLLAKARTSFSKMEKVESEKVEHLRQQIEQGQYSIQYEELARQMLAVYQPKDKT